MYEDDRSTRWCSWLRHCTRSPQGHGFSIPDGVSGIFIDIILSVALWPWGWLSLWQKWVPEVFPVGKGVGLTTLPSSCADCLEIWEPQPPEPWGPVQACNGVALHLPFYKDDDKLVTELLCCVWVSSPWKWPVRHQPLKMLTYRSYTVS